MPIRSCPVCRSGKIVRKDIKTCGAPDCVELWRHMTSSQRARAMDEASETVILESLPSPTFNPIKAPPPPSDSTTERDNRALEAIFGRDAPGVMRKPEDK